MAVEPNRWGIIYNPKAGSRKTQKRWNEIRSYMENRKVVFDYVQSEGFGSVERLARTLANNGYRTIGIVGGDGAINDAINGIMTSMVEDKTNIAFGIIPNGIGNDFAKYWGLDEDNYKAAVDWIINRRLRKIDVGRCNYFDGEKHTSRYFLNAIYIGLGARIVQISDGTRRFWGIRELSFVASMFLLLFERKLYRTHLCINGEHIRGRIMTVCVGSARGYGLTPSAVPYNGSWNGRSGQLCRRRNPEHRQRYNDRRERFQFRPRLRLLDCRLSPQLPYSCPFLEISTSAVG